MYFGKIFVKIFFLCIAHYTICDSQVTLQGDLIELIKSVRNALPAAGTNKFVIPSTNEMDTFKNVFIKLKNHNLIEISDEVKNFNYKFYEFIDTLYNRTYYILLEEIPIKFGWGTIIYSKDGKSDITIEVPHPIWDTNSWDIGIKVYIKLEAKYFIMAGTHRYTNTDSSSDVAHNNNSIFNTAHQTFATPISIQIHGFNKSNSIYSGYPDIVISNGTLYPQEILYTLSKNFEIFNFSTGVFSQITYTQLSRLGATTNIQGKWSNNNNKTFIHIEFDYPLRTNETNIQKIQFAIHRTFFNQDTVASFIAFKLFQNYPNPCNTRTIIEFETPKKAIFNLSIYDLLGKETYSSSINAELIGKYSIQIPLMNLTSGIYFYKLESENYKESKKMLIIK